MKHFLQQYILAKKTLHKREDKLLLEKREELKAIIEEAKANLDEINTELFNRANNMPERYYYVGDSKVMIVTTPNFSKVPLEFAKKFKAVKKVVDASVLRPLYAKGIAMPEVTKTEYVTVK